MVFLVIFVCLFRCLILFISFHGPLLYEAKVLSAELREPEDGGENAEKEPHLRVHYKGWKSTWDEWVPEDRALKWTEENLATQRELRMAALAAQKKTGKKSSGRSSESADGPSHSRGQKRLRDVDLEKEEDFIAKPEINIAIPDALKAQLVDDWENITKNQQLVSLPRSPTVTEILQNYKNSVSSTQKKRFSNADADIFEEVISGIKLYFDRCLGNILLYRFERQQYSDIRKTYKDKEMSDIYGAEHLLRLFVSLPELIAHTNMDHQSIQILKNYIKEFLKFLTKNQSEYFLKVYENASPNYQSLARCI
ncbi:uncharacterized protein T551_03462 [Pneumocystis jirovecii RU7]|uniref:Chromatin modification-related protein EAF3 n=1 Tax=Pneumocystis jirovecii (strain RU7) TaxID=1408657 RepID=A0A0W4ZDT3_PNEJ7|nr:uncharacterized protein T551_03462 [Pneumocystis jirovecii RU7]KTW26545.1 hypothetical protein T551_03462 [Pneumocystis jirovecii RU7]